MRRVIFVVFVLSLAVVSLRGQTPAFSYQGSLNLGGTPANGSYDFQFALYDVAVGGNPLTTVNSVNGVNVTNGIFNVTLFFGNNFPGNDRFIEIRVRPAGGGAHTVLTPRQQILSAPYAIRAVSALNANSLACFNCVDATHIASVSGLVVQGTIPVSSVPAGSSNYVQNGGSQQAAANFNISGTGTAQLFNAQSQFNIGGERVLSRPNSTSNTAVGTNASVNNGITNSTAIGNGAVATTNNTLMLGRTTERVIAPGSMVIGNRTTGPGELSIYPSGTNADLYMEGLGTTSGINFAAYPSFNGKSGLVMSSFNGVTHEEVINYTGGTTVINTNLDVIGRIQFEPISVGMATVFPVCQFTSPNHSVLSNCPSSSIRYKTNVADLSRGLDVLRRLRPVTFNWKESGDADFGLIAEEVAEVDPFLVYHNKKGEVEGVKYDRIGVFLINVVKEQQKQLDEQAGTIKRQQSELDALKQLVCMSNRDAAICR